MTFPALFVACAALTTLAVGPALADAMTPPVTMQPIPNPPEKPKVHAHKAKPAKKAMTAPAASK